MSTNTIPVAANPRTADQKVERIYQLIADARTWLVMHNIENAQDRLATADTLALELRHGPSLDNTLLKEYVKQGYHSDHDINDWVEVVLGNGMPPIEKCCITAVKFSQGGHVHFDLVYVTHVDDDGKENYQKLYHVPTGLINAIPKGVQRG